MVKKLYSLLVFIAISAGVYAQCNGSLGTPIIDETFGSGQSQFGPASPYTNMTYIANQCPDDGFYSIVNYTTGCFGLWHTLTDHTGDPNGYFMLINASYQPSNFYQQVINGLCDGTTYQFAAWIINMYDVGGGIEPNITFTITTPGGALLGTYDTGDIPVINPVTWKQYGFYFTTPAGVSSVVITMHNNAPGGTGNDLGIDDITFSPAGPQTTIAVNGITGNTANILCPNNVTLSSTVASCYVKNGYQWQISTDSTNFIDIPNANSPSYTASPTGLGTWYYRLNVSENDNIGNTNCSAHSNVYTVVYGTPRISTLTASICAGDSYLLPWGKSVKAAGVYIDTLVAANACDSIINVTLKINQPSFNTLNISICNGDSFLHHTKTGIYVDTLTAVNGCDSIVTTHLTVSPLPHLGESRTFCYGDSVILNPGPFSAYLWQDGTTAPTYKVTNAGIYWVKVTDANGCMAADTVVLNEIGCYPTKIPNAFTPNGDGINDTWNIEGLQGNSIWTIVVYTRWGQQVFSSTGYTKPWDGTYNGQPLPAGVYYYVIDLKNGGPNIAGYVTIIR